MVERIEAKGRLLRADGEPMARSIVALEVYRLEKGWTALARPKTDAKGAFGIEVAAPDMENADVAPFMRLADARGAPIVGAAQVDVEGKTLRLDYGAVTVRADATDDGMRLRDVRILGLEGDLTRMDRVRADTVVARDAAVSERNRLAGELATRDAMLRDLKPVAGSDEAVSVSAPLDEVAAKEVSRLKLKLLGAETVAFERASQADAFKIERDAAILSRNNAEDALAKVRASDIAAPSIAMLTGKVAESFAVPVANGMSVSDARVVLRGTVEGGGTRFKPLDAAELLSANAHAASEISFTIRPVQPAPVADGPAMPDVVGLTPGSAERVLRPFGRRIEVVETVGSPAGAVLRHMPEAGKPLPAGTTIRLVVATGEENT